MKVVSIKKIKANPKNPRVIRDDKFLKLMKSVEDFPDMINKRPLVVFTDVDENYVVLGGNMRLKVLQELAWEKVPVIVADEWTEEQKAEFLIKDNLSYGEWNWNEINSEWDTEKLRYWGMDVWKQAEEIDYSLLDEANMTDQISDMEKEVKKAIQIEFESEHYEEAKELVKYWREKELYIGGFLMEKLKEEKEKNV
jgi:ParB-like chromosome segregation protein Spo0J